MVNDDSRTLAEKAARIRNEAEAARAKQRAGDEKALKGHKLRARIYYGLVGIPLVVSAGLLIFLGLDRLIFN